MLGTSNAYRYYKHKMILEGHWYSGGTADREKTGTVMNGRVQLRIEEEIYWNSSKK